ncbi:LegC family aminotransferase [SAR202 cluster bacterium AD-802-F09_MRT_200m]|nr:LegC family aminotransferase [SAR202 cluster bacterium AD-802-F09_MRT_200m]
MKEKLAPGAPAVDESIPLSVPHIAGNEWKYVKECLDTNWVSSVGSFVDRFEAAMAEYVGTKHAVATINGTAALHTALMAVGVEPDQEVLVSTLTFVAPVNAIRYLGAWPVFMDSDPMYWQMDPEKVETFLKKECRWQNGSLVNMTSGRRVVAILPVHILGYPCDMTPIMELAKNYGLTVVEDATESLGASYEGRMVGRLGDIACFSFNGNKIITTGGGGMIVTDNQEWAERARYLSTQAKDDPVEYIHNEIGYNYRLTNIQAAMGVAQLEQLPEFISKKRAIAGTYLETFQEWEEITLVPTRPNTEPVHWLYTILLSRNTTVDQRKALVSDLNRNGIGARPLWHPIHGLPPYANCQAYSIEHADQLHARGVSLPSSVGLTDGDQERTVAAVKAAVGKLASGSLASGSLASGSLASKKGDTINAG